MQTLLVEYYVAIKIMLQKCIFKNFLTSPENMLTDFQKRGEGRGTQRETSMRETLVGCLSYMP